MYLGLVNLTITDAMFLLQGQTVSLSEHSMGVPPELRKTDPALCDALKILRLLHLKDLRGLQVQIRTFNYSYPR